MSQSRQLNLEMGLSKDHAGGQVERSASQSTHVFLPHGSDSPLKSVQYGGRAARMLGGRNIVSLKAPHQSIDEGKRGRQFSNEDKIEVHIPGRESVHPDGRANRKVLQIGPDLLCRPRNENFGVHFEVHTRARLGCLDPN